jgi:hypothetical protein
MIMNRTELRRSPARGTTYWQAIRGDNDFITSIFDALERFEADHGRGQKFGMIRRGLGQGALRPVGRACARRHLQ